MDGKPYDTGDIIDSTLPTDQYYASLEGSWDDNGNGIYGEIGKMGGPDEFSFRPDFYVGRLQAKDTAELSTMLNVTLSWAPKERPVHSVFKGYGCNFAQDEKLKFKTEVEWGQVWETREIKPHMCLNDSGGDIAAYINSDNADLVSSFSDGQPTQILGHYPLTVPSSIGKPPIFMVYACLTNAFDWGPFQNPDGYVLSTWLMANGQATAYIGSTRSHYDWPFDVFRFAYLHGRYRLGQALYDYKGWQADHEALSDRLKTQHLLFNLLGDPTLLFAKPPPVAVEMPEAMDSKDTSSIHINVSNKANGTLKATVWNLLLSEPDQKLSDISLDPFSAGPAQIAAKTVPGSHFGLWRDTTVRLGAANDHDSTYAVASSTVFDGHLLSTPESLSGVAPDSQVALQVKVLYGKDETVQLTVGFFPGCASATVGCDPVPPEQTLTTLGLDLVQEREKVLNITIPSDLLAYDSNYYYYAFPYLHVTCDKCGWLGVLTQLRSDP